MIFLGCLFNKKNEDCYLAKSKVGLSNAANTFQWNLIDGLISETENGFKIFNILPVGIFPLQYKDLILNNISWKYENADCFEIGCVNLPFIKQYQRYKKCYKLLKNNQDKEIVVYSAYLPFLRAISKLDKSYNITLIVTDLPEFYDLGKTNLLKKYLRERNNKKIYKCMKRVNNFVLLTEQMKEPLKVGNRPYIVVEGICNSENMTKELNCEESKEKIILYTGTLHKKFGIGNLISAFSLIDSPDYRLWICGGGDMKDEIINASEKDSRITFYGYVSKEKASELQQKATVLVNPRQNNDEFTKYSFPSKTMEYMASGKPVIMYKLDGIPAEYDEFLFYPASDSAKSLAESITNICEKTSEERFKLGERARNFVLNEKNGSKQAEKILGLIKIRKS